MVENDKPTLSGALWRGISWPVRFPARLIAGAVRRFGAVKFAMALLAGVCGVLLLWNLVMAPAFLRVMMARIPKPVVPITVAEAKSVTWVPGLEAVGTAKAFHGADMAAEADGVIAALHVAPQTRVVAGQTLMQIDDAVEQADLLAAQATVRWQESELARVSSLAKKGVSAQSRLDDVRNQLEVARAQLARIQALIDQKAVKAPFDGTAGIPRVDVGEYVTKGTVLITLQDLERIYVDFTVPEQSAGIIATGQTVRCGATKDALDFEGRIIGIDPKVDPQTRLVAVRAEISEARGQILPGQFLQLRIDLPSETDVIALPATAVVPSLYGDYVYLVLPREDGKAAGDTRIVRQVIVKTGRRNAGLVEITHGLAPGQMVVRTGQNTVQSGSAVRIENADPGKLADGGALP